MIDKNAFKEFCRVRAMEYSDELWERASRLMRNAIERAKDDNRKTLMMRNS